MTRVTYMRYYRGLLSPRAQKTYDALEHGLSSCARRFLLPPDGFQHAQAAVIALQLDQPALFCVDFDGLRFTKGRFLTQCEAAYLYSPADCRARLERAAAVAQRVCASLVGAGEIERELAVHDYLAAHVRRGGGTNASTLEGALLDGVANGMGFAQAFTYLAAQLDLPVTLVTGACRDQPDLQHSWNIVSLSVGYYHVDSSADQATGRYVSRAHVNLSDERIRREVEPHLVHPLPPCPKDALPMPFADTPDALMQVIRGASPSVRAMEIAVAHHFNDLNEVQALLNRKATARDGGWMSRLNQLTYDGIQDVLGLFFN